MVEKKQAEIRKVHPGLTCFKEGITEIPIESIPGLQVKLHSRLHKDKAVKDQHDPQLAVLFKRSGYVCDKYEKVTYFLKSKYRFSENVFQICKLFCG